MANYGFVIDNTACIGCHACSTACKSENQVPLGVYRTWVKYTEVGTYPDAKRHFQVTRCNHCANPPCARICPTGAMYQRDDGIVEFDADACIGCKACMQACPYDAIHIDPDTSTAAKCHFCSHRIEVGLEPSCAVVCPTHAIIAGDLDDPASEISRVVAANKVTVRKPEQGTAPKVFYIEGHEVSLTPTAAGAPDTFMWADMVSAQSVGRMRLPVLNVGSGSGSRRDPQPQGDPAHGPFMVGARQAAHMVQVGYDAQHQIPWHWPVPAYLVTKGIGAGLFLFLTLAFALGLAPMQGSVAALGAAVSVAFMAATTALLVYDLEKPTRFLYILLRPNWRSWLARGAIALIGFSTIAGLWMLVEAGAHFGWFDLTSLRPLLTWIGAPFALGAAVYTAFLFGQAEGRDLWQSTLLPMHLVVQALMMGSAAALVMGAFVELSPALSTLAVRTLAITIGVDLFMLLLGELGMPHASEVAARAAHEITRGRYARLYWVGAIVVGHLIPAALLFAGPPIATALAGVLCAAGLYAYEHAFVMAPQTIPNS